MKQRFCKQCGRKIARSEKLLWRTVQQNGFCSDDCQEVYEEIKERMKKDAEDEVK